MASFAIRGLALVAALAATTLTGRASAHLMSAGKGTLNVVDGAIFAVLAIPVASLHGFDDDGDGRLSLGVLRAHDEALRGEVDRRFALGSDGAAAATVRVDLVLSPQHEDAQDRAEQVVALKHVTFPGDPSAAAGAIHVATDLFGASQGEREVLITATRRPPPGTAGAPVVETARFTPGSPAHVYFAPPARPWGAASALAAGFAALLCAALPFRRRGGTDARSRDPRSGS